jgi:katanin p60 ATPase-containing subunit A1
VDLSAQIRQALNQELAKARAAMEEGEFKKASGFYSRSANLADKLERYLSTMEQRKANRESARHYRELAEKLAAGYVPSHAVPGGPVVSMEESETDFSDQVVSMIQKSAVAWEEIGGLEAVKEEIKTAFGLALARKPRGMRLHGWRSMLFYGPPGTGKTLLAAATSHSLEATFFNVKVSDVISKYFGESSKIIGALFNEARSRQPSVIFLDEVDALTASRDGDESGAERRVLSTLLSELDGFESKDFHGFLMTIAATNVPWMLDEAVISRFERKIYVPLPDPEAREAIIRAHLKQFGLETEHPPADIAARTDRFSGRDLARLCKAAINRMVLECNPNLTTRVDEGLDRLAGYELKVRRLSREDWEEAVGEIDIDVSENRLQAYENWRRRLA